MHSHAAFDAEHRARLDRERARLGRALVIARNIRLVEGDGLAADAARLHRLGAMPGDDELLAAARQLAADRAVGFFPPRFMVGDPVTLTASGAAGHVVAEPAPGRYRVIAGGAVHVCWPYQIDRTERPWHPLEEYGA